MEVEMSKYRELKKILWRARCIEYWIEYGVGANIALINVGHSRVGGTLIAKHRLRKGNLLV